MTPQSPAGITLEGISKRFGDLEAVRGIDLEIGSGEFFTVLGPSGCGKTTTLRMIAGFEEPTAGRILLDGEEITRLPAHRRPTNTVFQSYGLFPHLNVADNVGFGLKRKKVDGSEIKRRVSEELERVGLADRAGQRPAQLSGGMQQRVALARALVNLPKVLLLDEPLGALDLKLRKGLQIELKRIQRDVGITFVYVTHDQEEALTMSDRIAVMNDGRIEQIDPPAAVYERPATRFVAGFIGVSNLMPATVRTANGATAEVSLEHGPTVRLDSLPGLGPGDRCHAFVRPEKLQLLPSGGLSPEDRPSVEGLVESSLYLGTSTQIVVRVGEGVPLTVLVHNDEDAERAGTPGSGSKVRLAWAPEHMHLVADSPPGSTRSMTTKEESPR